MSPSASSLALSRSRAARIWAACVLKAAKTEVRSVASRTRPAMTSTSVRPRRPDELEYPFDIPSISKPSRLSGETSKQNPSRLIGGPFDFQGEGFRVPLRVIRHFDGPRLHVPLCSEKTCDPLPLAEVNYR